MTASDSNRTLLSHERPHHRQAMSATIIATASRTDIGMNTNQKPNRPVCHRSCKMATAIQPPRETPTSATRSRDGRSLVTPGASHVTHTSMTSPRASFRNAGAAGRFTLDAVAIGLPRVSFHDAEVHALRLDRDGPTLELELT